MEQTHKEDTSPAFMFHSGSLLSREKQVNAGSDSVEFADEKLDFQAFDDDEEAEFRNGEQVIATGRDVSRFVVDIRDDGDEALTFRSIVLGTIFAGMSAALCQVSRRRQLPVVIIVLVIPSPDFLLFNVRKVDYFRPDIPFQARPNDSVDGIFASDYLYCGKWLGKVLPSTQLGRWHSV